MESTVATPNFVCVNTNYLPAITIELCSVVYIYIYGIHTCSRGVKRKKCKKKSGNKTRRKNMRVTAEDVWGGKTNKSSIPENDQDRDLFGY